MKELNPGTLEEKKETEFIFECPVCKVLFHKEQLRY
jgi:uncharacterized protein (DUF2225 family)